MKKLHVVCTVALLALAAMVLIGCDQPTSNSGNNPGNPSNPENNPSDSWTKVETVDGLEGVWKFSASATIIQEGEAFQETMEMIVTYPTVDREVSIVQKIDGEPRPEVTIPKDEFEQDLKDGKVSSGMTEGGYMYINAAKTKLKVESVLKKADYDESKWSEIQMITTPKYEGDIKITSEPTQITVEQYYNKQK